ncbi:uncharacterized protein LOC143027605 [Oratosquilla oratoria]|uniref:uncharacterized protein LOC143027605 n=3 Tax=Oratosquilla oratoria TaxID=337810 RepID=UPI003F77625C
MSSNHSIDEGPVSGRVRVLTAEGQEAFQRASDQHEERVKASREGVQALLEEPNHGPWLYEAHAVYQDTVKRYLEFLMRERTSESLARAESVKHEDRDFQASFRQVISNYASSSSVEVTEEEHHTEPFLQDDPKSNQVPLSLVDHSERCMPPSMKGSSRRSVRSGRSSSTSVSVARKQRAKVETARIRVKFAEQEGQLMKEQAEMQAKFKVMTQQKELEEAEAELRHLGPDDDWETCSDWDQLKGTVATRTQLYVEQQGGIVDVSASQKDLVGLNPESPVFKPCSDFRVNSQPANNVPFSFEPRMEKVKVRSVQPAQQPVANHVSYVSPPVVKPPRSASPRLGTTSNSADLSKFFLRKDLLLSRLSTFDDTAEDYAVWKESFKEVVQELGTSCKEEIDLLVKYLGPESKEWARTTRNSNAKNPNLACSRIWERLDDRFAAPSIIETSIKKKLANFSRISPRDTLRLYDLCDILYQIEALKANPVYSTLFAYYDASSGINPIVAKLPPCIQKAWTGRAMNYKTAHGVPYPPFSFFIEFVKEMARVENDPCFSYQSLGADGFVKPEKPPPSKFPQVRVKKTDTMLSSGSKSTMGADRSVGAASPTEQRKAEKGDFCVYHDAYVHHLDFCRAFRTMSVSERKVFLNDKGVCNKCCKGNHPPSSCKERTFCKLCKAHTHVTALHHDEPRSKRSSTQAVTQHGREVAQDKTPRSPVVNQVPLPNVLTPIVKTQGGEDAAVNSKCTLICSNPTSMSKSCAKTFLVKVYPESKPELGVWCYAILDDQCNCSLARSEFFDLFDKLSKRVSYRLATCAGVTGASGRTTKNYTIESWHNSQEVHIPQLVECDSIPSVREEIPTPAIARGYPHLSDLAECIPPLVPEAEILLIIGRDVPSAHYIFDQRIGPVNAPLAQQTSLGWAIIGEVCLHGTCRPPVISSFKTSFVHDRRPSIVAPCGNQIHVSEVKDDLFKVTKDDDKAALSIEDRKFLDVMNSEFRKDQSGHWVAPLPFRPNVVATSNNRDFVWHRTLSLHRSLSTKPEKRQHMMAFMQKMLDRGHAEVAPPLKSDQKCWYLPLFGVYHPKKPDKIRVVFDSSAKSREFSLNDMLMSGPDMTNSILGILLRFRQEAVAVAADVEQMFYNFKVKTEQRDYLRFFWYKNNDPDERLIEYRMTVHVFGNTPSPAIATYGLRKSVEDASPEVRYFIENNFYVDDGLASLPDAETAYKLIQDSKSALQEGGRLRLHKITSNSKEVLEKFATSELAENLQELNLTSDSMPMQSSLGLLWDIQRDVFVYKFMDSDKPSTKRGILSVVNSLFDPMGFLAPVIIVGKLLLREITNLKCGWDEPIPAKIHTKWSRWLTSLRDLKDISINRQFASISLSQAHRIELHTFSDASRVAVGAVSYLKVFSDTKSYQVCFVRGQAKVAPNHGHTIPRLELCAAVMAVNLSNSISDCLDKPLDARHFYSDSMIVLGYIHNERRRFQVYVSNRVDHIRSSTEPNQWHYVPTDCNPADLATRGLEITNLNQSDWLSGPSSLFEDVVSTSGSFPLVSPETDKEVKVSDYTIESEPLVSANKSNVEPAIASLAQRFSNFSCWRRLVRAVALLKHIARSFKQGNKCCSGWHICNKHKSPDQLEDAADFIVQTYQKDYFSSAMTKLQGEVCLPPSSPIASLSPYLDQKGLLRVGGRLSQGSDVLGMLARPIIIPKESHLGLLLIRHYHETVHHQGRVITEGAVRTGGFWILGGKRTISKVISKCVTCKRVRGKVCVQKMGDLPVDRLTPNPPFSYVGVDLFGPWHIKTRRTRSSFLESKRWGVLFTCLVSRAIHIETVEELSTSSFINALKRFICIRGPVKMMRSDRGTNFVGAVKALNLLAITDEGGDVNSFLSSQGCTWLFNPPHASHMGGAWERMVGIVRNIMNVILTNHHPKALTHEVLVTFFAEVCKIVNSRPLVPVSSDPSSPFILSPSILLTQKTDIPVTLPEEIDIKAVYKSQWKHVHHLAEEFWKRWKKEYLSSLQPRRKWVNSSPNVKVDDVVLVKNQECPQGQWPLGIVNKVFPGKDDLVRKVQVRVVVNNKAHEYVRPISELVLLGQ